MDQPEYGLIETMRVREGRIPFLSRHLARLERSLKALDLGILPGIGRERVLELAAPVDQGRYARQQLAGKSLFLTNAVRGVVPIASLDGSPAPPDPRTAELAGRFWPAA